MPHLMNTLMPRSIGKYLLLSSLILLLFTFSASALVMRDNGPEPIIVQIKESLRLSNDLDDSLDALARLQTDAGLNVEKWWAGGKLLQMVSFPSEFTEEQAVEAIKILRQSPAIEKVVDVSAFNLEFRPGDFAREYGPTENMPQAARRGLATNQATCPVVTKCELEVALTAPHVANQIIVGWKPEYAWKADQTGFRQSTIEFHTSAGAHVVQEMIPTPIDLIQLIEFDDPETSLLDKLKEYENSPWVDYVQPNYLYSHFAIVPNDTYYTNPGQPYLSKIRAPQAWDPALGGTTGDHSVIVAVADGGLNIEHPDFRDRLSDGRRNFYAGQPIDDVTDRELFVWHGSHVASIIGAHGNNNEFMAGVAWDVRLLILRTDTSSINGVRVIDYAYSSDQGHEPAIAINCSWGLLNPTNCLDRALTNAIRRARQNNMVIVAAAGNGDPDHHGLDMDGSYLITPASVPTDNVISVGATRVRPDRPDLDDTKTTFSNYGKYRVELGAPGGEDGEQDGVTYGVIGLTQNSVNDPNSSNPCDGSSSAPCTKLSGTSFSAPQVAGALALVKSKYPWENYAGIRDRVIMGVDELDALRPDNPTGGFRTGGRLNLETALKPRTLIKNLSTRARVEGGEKVMIAGFVIGGSSTAVPLTVGIRGLGPSLAAAGIAEPLVDPVIELHGPGSFATITNDNWHDDEHWQDTLAFGLQPSDASEAALVRSLPPGAYTVIVRSHGSPNDYGVGLVELYALATTPAGYDEQSRFKNISTRCLVGTGANVAIAGTILQNPGEAQPQVTTNIPPSFPKRRILAFGRGPSLQRFGLTGLLPNPQLALHQTINDEDTVIAFNDQWKDIDGASTGLEDKLVASNFMPCPSAPDEYLNESAVWPTLHSGAYTAILSDAGNANGIALIEFYEF